MAMLRFLSFYRIAIGVLPTVSARVSGLKYPPLATAKRANDISRRSTRTL
jgi:hypothetical protein